MEAMKVILAVVAVAAAVVLGFVVNTVSGGAIAKKVAWALGPHGPVVPGQAMPHLTFEGLDGSSVTYVPAHGHVTFVNVFATWCTPCRAETPDLAAFAASEAGNGVDVIGIDQEETPAAVEAFQARYDTAYPMIIDTGRTTKDLLGARNIPRTLVLDGNGIIRAVVSGPMTRAQMDQLAAEAASGS
jgi:thiol-disulfide isomerase/thioredoxin